MFGVKISLSAVLEVNGDMIDDPLMVSNLFEKHYSELSSSSNYSSGFQEIQNELRSTLPSFDSDESQSYNAVFPMCELLNAIDSSGSTAVGPDDIHYDFIRHMSKASTQILLNFFNAIWEAHFFPPQWKHSYIVPMLKPGKPTHLCSSYRPIQLTSYISKVYERMIANRLKWYAEKHQLFHTYQCAFRKGRSTLDHILRLETDVREGFFKKEYTVAVFLDIKSAYNLVSKDGLMTKLYDLGFRGRFMHFISQYLSNRTFQVKSLVLSDRFPQENGVVQGGVISPLLFLFMINDVFNNMQTDIKHARYADDCTLWVQHPDVHVALHKIQVALGQVEKWANKWGYIFSAPKSQAIIYKRRIRKVKFGPLQRITINGNQIELQSSVRFLGVILDQKLMMKQHLEDVKARASKRVSVLKCVAASGKGVDRKILLSIYKSLVRPILEYCCQIFDGSNNRLVMRIETIQNQCLRIVSGAFRTSPVTALRVECNIPPLWLRRWDLSIM